MTPKQIVRAQYPKAYADQHIRGRNWHIFDEMFRRTPALSSGRIFGSARAAWAYAAEKLDKANSRRLDDMEKR